MAEMSNAELRVTLAVIRATFGYRRDSAKISLTEMAEMTGMAYTGVSAGMNAPGIKREHDGKRTATWSYSPSATEGDDPLPEREEPSATEGVLPLPQRETPSATEVQSRGTESIKESIKDKEAIVFSIYENNIGLLTPVVSQKILSDLAEYPAGWVEDAIGKAVLAEKRSYSYVQGILRNWKRDGRKNGNGNGQAPQKSLIEGKRKL